MATAVRPGLRTAASAADLTTQPNGPTEQPLWNSLTARSAAQVRPKPETDRPLTPPVPRQPIGGSRLRTPEQDDSPYPILTKHQP